MCTFTNTKQGKVQVVKTQLGVTPPDAAAFTFELRSGATTDTINPAPPPADAVLPGNPGTLLETQVANLGNDFSPEFATWLVPGDTYQLCEVTPASGWVIDFAGYTEFNLTIGGENIRVCIDFTVAAGEELSIARGQHTASGRRRADDRLLEELDVLRRQGQPGAGPR